MNLKLLLLPMLFSCSNPQQADETVYLCKSENAVAYHKSENSCKGILNCSHQIIKTTRLIAVKKYKYRPCKLCFQHRKTLHSSPVVKRVTTKNTRPLKRF